MKSNIEWKKWGERDPLYAVSTWQGREKGSQNAWTDQEFYELGKSDWEDFYNQWQHYGVEGGHCLEIGCGAGRITNPLAGCFERVTATDVSQHQLDYAMTHVPPANVQFILTEGVSIPLDDDVCDGTFSCHVFQHFESHKDAYAVFREVHRILRPHGSLMIHLPVYQLPDISVSTAIRPALRLLKRLADVRAAFNRMLLEKGKWRFVMRRLRFEQDELFHALAAIGFVQIEYRCFPVRSNNDHHGFVLARKARTRGGRTESVSAG